MCRSSAEAQQGVKYFLTHGFVEHVLVHYECEHELDARYEQEGDQGHNGAAMANAVQANKDHRIPHRLREVVLATVVQILRSDKWSLSLLSLHTGGS